VGLPWVRLDTQFPSNPKVLELVAAKQWRALCVYLSSLAYCGQHGTDGYIPDTALPFIHATRKEANVLVEHSMWDIEQCGWAVHDWDECQVSDEATRRRRVRAMKGGVARWEKARKAGLHGV
jgi:hypothetical protein